MDFRLCFLFRLLSFILRCSGSDLLLLFLSKARLGGLYLCHTFIIPALLPGLRRLLLFFRHRDDDYRVLLESFGLYVRIVFVDVLDAHSVSLAY